MFMIPIKIYNFHTEHRTSIHDFEKLVIAVARAFRVSHINCWRKCYFSFLRKYATKDFKGSDKHNL